MGLKVKNNRPSIPRTNAAAQRLIKTLRAERAGVMPYSHAITRHHLLASELRSENGRRCPRALSGLTRQQGLVQPQA